MRLEQEKKFYMIKEMNNLKENLNQEFINYKNTIQ